MKNSIGFILAIAFFGAGAWLLLSTAQHDDHNDDHDHAHQEHHDEDEHHELVAKEPVRADGEFTITTSFYPLQFALEQIVGDLATVNNIGAGQDPHDFRPSTQNIATLQQSDLVVLQGAEFEPWGDAVQEQLQTAGVPVAIATDELALLEAGEDGHDEHHEDEDEHHDKDHDHREKEHDDHEDEGHDDHAHGAYDPHTWIDPVLFSQTVEHLTEAVSSIDPENADTYAVNAATLLAELDELNNEYQTTLATCSVDEVIATHDAFGYLAARYDIEIHTIAGLSTQDVPSATTLAELKEEAEEGVLAILLEENSVTAYGETLARETGLQTLPINPIAYAVPAGSDYLTIARANLNTFSVALGCNE